MWSYWSWFSLCGLKSADVNNPKFSYSTAYASALQKGKTKKPTNLRQKKCFRTGPMFLGGVCTCKINVSLFGYMVGLKTIPFWILALELHGATKQAKLNKFLDMSSLLLFAFWSKVERVNKPFYLITFCSALGVFDLQLESSFFMYSRIHVMFTCQLPLEQLHSREWSVKLKSQTKPKLLEVSQTSLLDFRMLESCYTWGVILHFS